MGAVAARRPVMIYGWSGLVFIPYTRHRIFFKRSRRCGNFLGVENIADCQTFMPLLYPWRWQRRGCWYRLEFCISGRGPSGLFRDNWYTWCPSGIFAGCSLTTTFIFDDLFVPLSTLDFLELSFQHIVSLLIFPNGPYRLISV